MTLTLFRVCSGDISEKEYHGDSEDSGVWAARRQRSSRCKPIPSRRRLRRVGRSEDLYLYSRDEHQWTILQSVVGRVKTGMMVSWIVNTGYWLYQWCIIFLYAYFRLRWLARMLTFYRSKNFSEVTMCNQRWFSHLLIMLKQEEIMRTRCLTRCGINVTRNSYSGTNFMSR